MMKKKNFGSDFDFEIKEKKKLEIFFNNFTKSDKDKTKVRKF